MRKITEFLVGSLGTLGLIISHILVCLICVFPLLMFDLPWFVYTILALLMIFVLSTIPLVIELEWCIGLVGAIMGKQDTIAIVYYVLFAIIIGGFLVNLFRKS